MVRRHVLGLALVVGFALVAVPHVRAQATDTIPDRLTDAEFWRLSEELSEPGGYFRSDNLLSNELYFPDVLPGLIERVKPGGVYLGVGPEQNFQYIVAIRPKIAFINDVRRGNLHTQLMYKALFELSADRIEFVSRLFTKPRPASLSARSTATEIMNTFWATDSSAQAVFDQNLKALTEHLTKTRGLPLGKEDLDGIAYVYSSFYWFGPAITYNSSTGTGGGRGSMTNYAQLMMATDANGQAKSYLASEETFRFLKDLESRNLIVPVVGNFGGPRALKAIGEWVRGRGANVSVFYLSNVEQYLRQDGIWGTFCANVASMPLTAASTFIRSQSLGGGGTFQNTLGDMQAETAGCAVPAGAGSAR